MRKTLAIFPIFLLFLNGCQVPGKRETVMKFQDDVEFLRRYKEVIVLSDQEGQARVAVVGDYQGRVMTSSAEGDRGLSFGWINRALITSGKRQPHINVLGGEDRFWLGPEGGQYSIFFQKGAPFDLEHWFVPAAIDWDPFKLVAFTDTNAVFTKDIHLKNYSGSEFDLEVTREIRLLSRERVEQALRTALDPEVRLVGFESVNTIRNTGTNPWQKQTGLLSIWILGMFNPSPSTTVIIPFKPGAVDELGPVVNDAYFGKVPAARLVVKDSVLFFRGDGKYRCKIGLSPRRCKPILGSYDSAHNVLTLVQFNLPPGASDYVNSMWELQKHPYGGDVVNSYNDGPPAPGAKPLGPFYELETSSPAAALSPGETLTHVHRTFHMTGPETALNHLVKALLHTTLKEVQNAFQVK